MVTNTNEGTIRSNGTWEIKFYSSLKVKNSDFLYIWRTLALLGAHLGNSHNKISKFKKFNETTSQFKTLNVERRWLTKFT